jgi:hypothetical protein
VPGIPPSGRSAPPSSTVWQGDGRAAGQDLTDETLRARLCNANGRCPESRRPALGNGSNGAILRIRRSPAYRPVSTDSGRSRGATEPAALSVSAGGSSKQEKRWRKDGSEPEAEALSKRQEADLVGWKCRAAVLQQNPLRSPQSPRSAALGLLGKRCCAPDQSRARRRALRLQVQQGVPVPRRHGSFARPPSSPAPAGVRCSADLSSA